MESNSRERKEYKMVLQREREMKISGLGNENIVVKREAGFMFKRLGAFFFFGCRYRTVHFHA